MLKRPIVRWLAAAAAALICAIGVLLPPFACAVGEYELDNRACDTPVLQIIGFGVLTVGVIAARLTRRPALHWAAVVASVVLVLLGLDQV